MPRVDAPEGKVDERSMLGGFYIGIHILSLTQHFPRSFISINRLRERRSWFPCPGWVMDSGAFTEISTHGHYRHGTDVYAAEIKKWARIKDLSLHAAVTQDYMCEPFILNKTGLTVEKHQRLTVERYDALLSNNLPVYLLPVLQGYAPVEYVNHVRMYGRRLKERAWVGVGSICKRNASPKSVVRVLEAIYAERPDLRLHGFGLKTTALEDRRVRRRLHSADSMAWSFAARREGRDANGLKEAREFWEKINRIIKS